MSKPRYDWWSYMKAIIRRYPDRLDLARESQSPCIPIPAAWARGEKSNKGFKKLTPQQRREFAAVHGAVLATRRLPDGPLMLKLVRLVFWEQRYTLQGAAMQAHISYRTARRWQSQFICLVAKNLGLMDETGPQEPTWGCKIKEVEGIMDAWNA